MFSLGVGHIHLDRDMTFIIVTRHLGLVRIRPVHELSAINFRQNKLLIIHRGCGWTANDLEPRQTPWPLNGNNEGEDVTWYVAKAP